MKYLYRHLFLEDTSKKASVTQKIAPPKLLLGYFPGAFLQMPRLGLWPAKTLSCNTGDIINKSPIDKL